MHLASGLNVIAEHTCEGMRGVGFRSLAFTPPGAPTIDRVYASSDEPGCAGTPKYL